MDEIEKENTVCLNEARGEDDAKLGLYHDQAR